jgi:hypothetical protein
MFLIFATSSAASSYLVLRVVLRKSQWATQMMFFSFVQRTGVLEMFQHGERTPTTASMPTTTKKFNQNSGRATTELESLMAC